MQGNQKSIELPVAQKDIADGKRFKNSLERTFFLPTKVLNSAQLIFNSHP